LILGSHPFRRYLAVLLVAPLLGAGGVTGVNALVDPLWFFTHAHRLNRAQISFDQRAQKTNWLHARRGRFDAVLLGSSRSTYIDQHDFAPLRLFNYAAESMMPQEYRPYLDHFARANGRPPAVVVLGVDFFGGRDVPRLGDRHDAAAYTGRAGDPRHLAGALLSLDLLGWSLRTAARSAGLHGPVARLDR
jgi:hypothetical protein